jgi:hypothetical protein
MPDQMRSYLDFENPSPNSTKVDGAARAGGDRQRHRR